MKMVKYTLLLILLTSNFFLSATTYTSTDGGDWTSSDTWSPAGVPGIGDEVIINGHTVTHDDGTVYIDKITITNSSGSAGRLHIESSGKIIVTNNVIVNSHNFNADTRLKVKNSGELEVGGNISFERQSNNTKATRCQLYMEDDAKVTILGNYIYNHKNGFETKSELWMQENAILTVEGDFLWERSHTNPGPLALDLRGNAQFNCLGNLEAKLTGGDMIDFYITDQSTFTVEGDMTLLNTTPDDTIQVVLGDDGGSGTLTVGGNLNINSTAAGNLSEIRANGANTIINVGEDISLSAVDTCTSRLSLLSSSSLNLAGTILRPNNFGILTMGADAVLNLNGTEPQILAPNNLAGSGMDSLLYTNITFNNTSGSPTTLTGPLVVEDQLAMDGGIIRSSASNPLILEDNATIGVGSSTSFIDGPIIKKGRTGDGGITLPTGKDGVYAPIKISEMADEDGEITAEYFSEPPPFGNDNTNFESVVEDISQQGYWSVEKSAEVGDVNYTLHWTDAQALGIYDLSSLIVVGLDNNTWRSYGQGATTGGVGPGVEGSITNAYSEPPPFGIEYLTFGSTSASNKLPVELSKFVAIPQGGKVRLQWQTLTEVDFSHFVIERSKDGYYFERLGFVESKGGNTVTDYTYDDPSPLNNWNYYRLKIIDTDDTYEYSDIEIVKIDDMEQFQLYPNPVRDQIEIKGIDWDNGQLKLEVFDKNGKLVYSNFTDFENGYYEVTTEAIHVQQPGIYFIRLSTGTRSQYLKFVKVND